MSDVKTLILDKALDRIARFGLKKTTMDEISRDCGISKKTIYGHFADKDDMFTTLLLRECRRTAGVLFRQAADVPDPLDRLIILIRNSIAYLNQDHFLTRVLRDDDLFMTFVNRKYHDIIDDEIIAGIARIVREGIATGKFRDVDDNVVAYAGYKLFQAFSYARTGPLRDAADEERYTRVLEDFIVNALVKR